LLHVDGKHSVAQKHGGGEKEGGWHLLQHRPKRDNVV
jgi:hypothetical protein